MRTDVDHSIFEAIRKAIVQAGYLPDATAFTTDQAWNKAKEDLKAQIPEKTLIGVKGVGGPEKDGDKRDAQITVRQKDLFPGSIGGYPATYWKLESGTPGTADAIYSKHFYPNETVDVEYYIHTYVVSENLTPKYDRLMQQIIFRALNGYVPIVDEDGFETGEYALTEFTGTIDQLGSRGIERQLMFNCLDIWPHGGNPVPKFERIGVMSSFELFLTPSAKVVDDLSYLGLWDASENEPELSNGDANMKDYFYFVETGGTVDFGDGNSIDFKKGDAVFNNGTGWLKLRT